MISSIIFAMEAKRVGKSVAVFFVQGPLATLAEGNFEWAEELKDYGEKIEENLKRRKLSANPLELLKIASRIEVDLIGCGA